MKKLVILFLVFTGIILPVQLVKANVQLKWEDVASMEINRTSGGTRTFNENDGIEAFVIKKVIEWINTASPVKETMGLVDKKTPIAVLKIKMKNGDVAIVEPAYPIIPGQIKLKKFEHLETHELPSHWQNIIKKKAR